MIPIRKGKKAKPTFPFEGTETALSGLAAVTAVEAMISDVLIVQRLLRDSDFPRPNPRSEEKVPEERTSPILVKEAETGAEIMGLAEGWNATGMRTAAVMGMDAIDAALPALKESANKRLSLVLHVIWNGASGRQTNAGNFQDLFQQFSLTGTVVLHARNAQEAVDFTLIAHRLAELALTPVLCIQEGLETASSVQVLRLPSKKIGPTFPGEAADIIEVPTPAQELLFGKKRRRVPQWIDLSRPAGIGSALNGALSFKSMAGGKPYFADHRTALLQHTLEEFRGLTGRSYAPAMGYRLEDAEYAVVAHGAIAENLTVVVDYLRRELKIKAGAIFLPMVFPFPAAQISHLLKGRKVVTLLERSDPALLEQLPLAGELQSAQEKASENGGVRKGPLPFPEYAVYEKPSDRARIFAGVYGETPGTDELLSVYLNMIPGGEGKRFFFLGVQFTRADMRFPILEMYQMRIRRAYPNLQQWVLAPPAPPIDEASSERGICLVSHHLSSKETFQLLGIAIHSALKWQVRSAHRSSIAPGMLAGWHTLEVSPGVAQPRANVNRADALLVTRSTFLRDPAVAETVKPGGAIILSSGIPADQLWASFSDRVRQVVRKRNLRMFYLDSEAIVREISPLRKSAPRLSDLVLIGALSAVDTVFGRKEFPRVADALRQQLIGRYGERHPIIEESTLALSKGADVVQPLQWEKMPPLESLPVPEPEIPWVVREVTRPDQSAFDLTRFWDTVGFLYESGRSDQELIDPAATLGLVPADSAAFRDFAPLRTHLPRLIPEACTGCGACWAQCPDSAMPVSLQDFPTLIESAIQQAGAAGTSMVHLPRLAEHLARQAHRLFARDELRQYLSLGALLQEAFVQLLEKTSPREEQKKEMEREFAAIRTLVQDVPIVRTATFFDKAEDRQKGSGKVLTLVVDSRACKACGLCLSACPEDALEMVPQTDALLTEYRANFEFLRKLPEVGTEQIQPLVSAHKPESFAYYLLNKKVYYSLTGGDAATPGSGIKTALHLALAAIEAQIQPHLNKFLAQIDSLISRLDEKIQGTVSASLRINDLEEFGRKLNEIQEKGLTLKTLAELMSEEEAAAPGLDKQALQHMTSLATELKNLRKQYREGLSGRGRAHLSAAATAERAGAWNGVYPYNPYPFPWIFELSADAAATAEGIFEGVMTEMAQTFRLVRTARMVLEDTYDPQEQEAFFRKFSWRDFSEEEWKLCPPVLFMGISTSSRAALYHQAERLILGRLPVKVLIINAGGSLDLEALAPSDKEGRTADSPGWSQEIPGREAGLAALVHRNVFVLQSSAALTGHLMAGVMEGVQLRAPAFFHIYASEPELHELSANQSSDQASLAVESRAFPVFKFNPYATRELPVALELSGNPAPEKDWATRSLQVIDASGIEREIHLPVTFADWAVQEGRFKAHFRLVPRSKWHAGMRPLVDYLALSPEERTDLEPYIQVVDRDKNVWRVEVSPAMVAACEDRLRLWHHLQELAAVRLVTEEAVQARVRSEVEKAVETARQQVEAEYQAKIQQMETEHQAIYHSRLTQKLLALSGFSGDAETLKQSLLEFVKKKTPSNGEGSDPEAQ